MMPVRKKRLGNVVSAARRPRLRVAFILAPRFTLTAFAGFVDALRLSADESDRSRPIACEWSLLGDGRAPVAASCGAEVWPWGVFEAPEQFDYIVVVGGLLHGGQAFGANAYRFLRRAADVKVPLVGLCTGSFVLARAGLLNDYKTCVSWFHRDEFQREFPGLNICSDRMFIVDRDRLTCAGGTSVVHLAAHIIERHFGLSRAVKSLRILLEDAPLPANAWQPVSPAAVPARDPVVRQSMLHIEQRLTDRVPISRVLQPLGVGMRQIERRFVRDIGIGPREYRLSLRVDRARWMLENTDHSVIRVAQECGFTDSSHFARAFKNRAQMLPSQVGRIGRREERPIRSRRLRSG